tara:strand:+ start:7292 stop:8152 length:861 start_codon:yes stop_codon:yes gene_type:complete
MERFLVFLAFISRFLIAQDFSVSKNSLISEFLKEDLKELKTQSNSIFFKHISSEKFTTLFYEGVCESASFLDSFILTGQIEKYKKQIQKAVLSHQKTQIQHDITSEFENNSFLNTIYHGAINGYNLFNLFSGKWFGHWNLKRVEHYWLTPRLVENPKSAETFEISIESFQSAFTGDGFGWNYQICKDDTSYIVGFVCHYNSNGEIIMKRPHIGIPQADNSIIWITRNHVYFEFVCKDLNHRDLSTHYVISGASFQENDAFFEITKTFQAVYFNCLFDSDAPVRSHL